MHYQLNEQSKIEYGAKYGVITNWQACKFVDIALYSICHSCWKVRWKKFRMINFISKIMLLLNFQHANGAIGLMKHPVALRHWMLVRSEIVATYKWLQLLFKIVCCQSKVTFACIPDMSCAHLRCILDASRIWQKGRGSKSCCSFIARFYACTDASRVCSGHVLCASCTHSRHVSHVFWMRSRCVRTFTLELSCTVCR